MNNLRLTHEEIRVAYFKPDGLNEADPHKAGLIKIAEDQTLKILAWLKDNGEPIFDDWNHQCGIQIQGEAWKLLLDATIKSR